MKNRLLEVIAIPLSMFVLSSCNQEKITHTDSLSLECLQLGRSVASVELRAQYYTTGNSIEKINQSVSIEGKVVVSHAKQEQDAVNAIAALYASDFLGNASLKEASKRQIFAWINPSSDSLGHLDIREGEDNISCTGVFEKEITKSALDTKLQVIIHYNHLPKGGEGNLPTYSTNTARDFVEVVNQVIKGK